MKKWNKFFHRSLARVLTIGLLFGSVAASGATLRVATGFPPDSQGAIAAQSFADSLEEYSSGEHSAKVYPMSLLSFQESSAGVRDGVVDVAVVIPQYFSNQFPTMNLLGEIAMSLIEDLADPAIAGLAFSGAVTEFVLTKCPKCIDEMKVQNQLSLGFGATSPYALVCNKPVYTAAGIQGKRIRVAGGRWARWVEAMGATPVSMATSDTYEALSQGVIDCSAESPSNLITFRLDEVVTDITPAVPGGLFGTAGQNINLETWTKLEKDGRRDVLRAAAMMTGVQNWLVHQQDKRALDVNAADKNIAIHDVGDDLREATASFTERDIASIAKVYEERYGIENAQQVLDEFWPVLDRWLALAQLRSVESAEQLAEIYWKEAFSKVNVMSYGQ